LWQNNGSQKPLFSAKMATFYEKLTFEAGGPRKITEVSAKK
jgi:hypothetical protein